MDNTVTKSLSPSQPMPLTAGEHSGCTQHPQRIDASNFDVVSPGPTQRLKTVLNGPVAAALLVGANLSALQGSPKWTLGCLTAAIGTKHVEHPVSYKGYAMLAAAGLYCGIRYACGASPWLDAPVAVAGIAVCIKQGEAFEAWPWLSQVRLREDAALYSSRVETDKILIGSLALLLNQMEPLQQAVPHKLISAALGAGTIAALMGAGISTGFVRFDPRPPDWATTLAWSVVNLTLVAASEEALFRGLSLRGFQAATNTWPAGQLWPVAATSLMFGYAHRRGGPTYMALSAVAGTGYGAVVAMTGRLEAGIALHFALNAVHFVAFTYPNRASSAERKRLSQERLRKD